MLLACFMNSEYHLYSKISKQGLFIRCTKKVLVFDRNCCMRFTEVTGRARSYFFGPHMSAALSSRRGTRRFPEVPSSLKCSVILGFGDFMCKTLVERNVVFQLCFGLALICLNNWICF